MSPGYCSLSLTRECPAQKISPFVMPGDSTKRAVPTNVFYEEGSGIWSSFNVTSLRVPFPEYSPNPPRNLHAKYVRQPQWLTNAHPFVAFWPLYPPFTGPLFSRLNICQQNLKITHLGHDRYMLDSDIIQSWDRLEQGLLDVSFILLRRAYDTAAEPALLQLPSECGYRNQHRQENFVRISAFKSRDAFVGLSALCSFAIASNLTGTESDYSDPPWLTACAAKGVLPQWLHLLRDSFVCKFGPGVRPGAYVNGYESTWARSFPAFLRAAIPIWIWWGEEGQFVNDQTTMIHYLPTSNEVAIARDRASRTIPGRCGTHSSSNAPTLSRDAGDLPPTPLPGSRQKRGENWEEFSSRMAGEHAAYHEEMETAQDEEIRRSKEMKAELERMDELASKPTIGIAMFEWISAGGGYHLRQLVHRQEWEARWGFFAPSTRYYDGFTDEWDLTPSVTTGRPHEFEVHADDAFACASTSQPEIPGEEGSSTPSLETHYSSPSNVTAHQRTSSPTATGLIYLGDVQNIWGGEIKQSHMEPPSLLSILRERYGFLVQAPYTTDARMVQNNETPMTHSKILQTMSTLAVKTCMGSDFERAAIDLFTRVTSWESGPIAFAPLWDFEPSFRERILNHHHFLYQKVSDDLHLIGIRTKPLEKQWYLLAVNSATTVLQIFRESPTGVLAAVRFLLRWGIPFGTPRCRREKPYTPERRSRGLGHRPIGFQPNIVDYKAYEDVKAFILHSALGRAALMEGGILWRLAWEVAAHKSVTQGPSSLSQSTGRTWGTLRGQFLVDDQLETADEDVICGVYHVYTGMYAIS